MISKVGGASYTRVKFQFLAKKRERDVSYVWVHSAAIIVDEGADGNATQQ